MVSLLLRLRRNVLPLILVVLLAFTAFFIASAVTGHSDAQRSTRVQQHGVRVVGTVSKVHVQRHTTNQTADVGVRRYRYTTDVTLALSPAVQGHANTNLHFERQVNLVVGQAVTVLLDPDDPGYAEQPGDPASTVTHWKVMAALSVVGGLLTLLLAGILVRRRMRARRTV